MVPSCSTSALTPPLFLSSPRCGPKRVKAHYGLLSSAAADDDDGAAATIDIDHLRRNERTRLPSFLPSLFPAAAASATVKLSLKGSLGTADAAFKVSDFLR